MPEPPDLSALSARLAALGWVTDVFVGGSAATGDYHYWATASRRPWWWLDRTMIDLT